MTIPVKMPKDPIFASEFNQLSALLDPVNQNKIVHSITYFIGVVTNSGPSTSSSSSSSSDYNDERYWIKRQYISNTASSNTEAITTTDMPSPFDQWVTATNFYEVKTHTHQVDIGTPVLVWNELTTQASPPVIKYYFAAPPVFVGQYIGMVRQVVADNRDGYDYVRYTAPI